MSDGAPRLLITAFAPFPAGTGLATRLAQRITSLADAGYAIDVLTPKTAELPHVSRLGTARILRVPMPRGEPSLAERTGAFERAVLRQFAASDYDAVHTFDPFSGAALVKRKGSARLVFETEGARPDAEGDAFLEGELRRRERDTIRDADAVLVPTEELQRRAKGIGADPKRVMVLRPSADPTLFAPPHDRRRRPDPTLRVLACRAAFAPRDLALLAEAFALLDPALPVTLTLAGALDDAELRNFQLSGVRRDVKVVAPVLYEDLPPILAEHDVGVVVDTGPVHGELPPVPLQSIAEMASSGLALVLPALPAVKETFDDTTHALLVPPSDARAIAMALELLAREPVRRRQLGTAARARAAERLDERHGIVALLALYNRLIAPSIQVAVDTLVDAKPPADDPDTRPGTPISRPPRGALNLAKTPAPIPSPLLDERTSPGEPLAPPVPDDALPPAEPVPTRSVITRRELVRGLSTIAPQSGTDPEATLHGEEQRKKRTLAELAEHADAAITGPGTPGSGATGD